MRIAVATTAGAVCPGTGSLWGDMWTFSPRSIGLLALTLLYDPALLGAYPSPPAVEELTLEEMTACASRLDLAVFPHAHDLHLPAALAAAIERGLPALLAGSDPAALAGLRAASSLAGAGRLLSMDEEWRLGGGVFDYPQALTFERWQVPPGARVLSAIGEWPDAVVLDRLAVTATDAFHAADLFRPIPSQHRPGGFQDLFPRHLAGVIAAITELPGEPLRAGSAGDEYDLRRDFHAFGFARFMTEELLRRLGQQFDPATVDEAAWSAARAWREGCPGGRVATELGRAFAHLAESVNHAAPLPRYMLDSLHGGVMLGGYGFAEYDSPRYVRDWFDLYIHWVETRGYRFSVEIGAGTLAGMAGRYPAHLAGMMRQWRKGRIEVVNGTRAQPYPYLLSLAANARQFATGREALTRVTGERVRSYVAQEFGLTSRHPDLLCQFGYDLACHRAQNWGRTPVEGAPAILWEGADGARILALPASADGSERRIGTTYLDWPAMTAEAVRAGVPLLALTNLLDFFWMPAFREETLRANHYAPIFGRFVTFQDLRPILAGYGPSPRRYAMDDYEMDGFSRYPWAGGISGTLLRAREAENLILAADLLGAMAALIGRPVSSATAAARAALADYENHDCFCVPHAEAGGHTSHYASIVGPRRSVTVREAAEDVLERSLADLEPVCADLLTALAPCIPGDGHYLALNLCAQPYEGLLPLLDGTTLLLNLPPLGLARCQAVPTPTRTDAEPLLKNGLLRVEFCPRSGAFTVAGPGGDGPVIARGRAPFWGEPEGSATRIETFAAVRSSLWQRAEMTGRLTAAGRPAALFYPQRPAPGGCPPGRFPPGGFPRPPGTGTHCQGRVPASRPVDA